MSHILVCHYDPAGRSLRLGAQGTLTREAVIRALPWDRQDVRELILPPGVTALAIGQMMLQAADLGLGTTYIGVFDPQVLKAELAEELEGLTPLAVLPLGYPREDAHPSRLHAERKPVEELVRYL